MDRVDIASLSLNELKSFVATLGEKPFRAGQVYRWIHRKGARSFAEMSDLSQGLRARLDEQALLHTVQHDIEQRSVDGTIKFRFRTHDGYAIESVYMPSPDRKTLCVSTQVGCAMGCTFCMTATLGLKRHLLPSEIVAQVHQVNRWLREELKFDIERPLTNLVFMGMGEPLHNFENVVKSIDLLQSEEGPNFSNRHITVSTVGLVQMIDKFAARTNVKLAISLNASNDATRSKTMPINKKWPIATLMDAVRRFPDRQGRRVTFEYVLLEGVNDADANARELATLLRGVPAKVNLIPYNDNPGLGFHSTSGTRADEFRALLTKMGVDAFVRQNRGRDIAAACGQLANVDRESTGASPAPM